MLSRMIWRVGSVALLAVLAAFPAPVAAQTSDGVTPAEETACNGQSGAAYGLCTSFCEAMDCDSTAPAASPTACNKVYDKFLQLTGAAPPCSCPCSAGWDQVQQAAADASLAVTVCATAATESQVQFGPTAAVRLNLVSYTVEGSYCTGWNGDQVVSRTPLTAPQISACRSIISNICTQAQLP
jgi:hypothetical protein